MAIPTKDSALAAYSTNFNTRIVATPTDFGLTAAQATEYTGLHDLFIDAYDAANVPGSRSKSLVAAKDNAKKDLLDFARELYAFVQANTAVTDANKELLGVVVRKTQLTPVPVPEDTPKLEIVDRLGTVVKIKLHDGTGSRRGRPVGVAGASVFSYIGATPPVDVHGWSFHGNTTKTLVDVDFPVATPAGTVVWFTAFWYNPRGQSGQGCAPVSALIAGGAMQQAA